MSAAIRADLVAFPAWEPLTTLQPTAGDLRYRAFYWQTMLDDGAGLDPVRRAAVLANCQAMRELADRMDNPAPVVRIVPARPAPARKAKASKAKAASSLGAEDFWSLHAEAVRAIVALHGPAWRSNRPEETIEVTLPARLCRWVSPRGHVFRRNRDHHMPAPKYWPDGRLPDGVEALPVAPRYTGPMGDDHPSLVMIRAAREEQIMRDRIGRGRAAIVDHWKARHLASLLHGQTYQRNGQTGDNRPRAQRLDNLALAGNCRRAMLAELAAWRAGGTD
jgi:hypothetical protein